MLKYLKLTLILLLLTACEGSDHSSLQHAPSTAYLEAAIEIRRLSIEVMASKPEPRSIDELRAEFRQLRMAAFEKNPEELKANLGIPEATSFGYRYLGITTAMEEAVRFDRDLALGADLDASYDEAAELFRAPAGDRPANRTFVYIGKKGLYRGTLPTGFDEATNGMNVTFGDPEMSWPIPVYARFAPAAPGSHRSMRVLALHGTPMNRDVDYDEIALIPVERREYRGLLSKVVARRLWGLLELQRRVKISDEADHHLNRILEQAAHFDDRTLSIMIRQAKAQNLSQRTRRIGIDSKSNP